ncbi:potassium-transporting ATPase subunit KdpA [Nakamurella lactea]|uniref:potassium-transporting ATPase subunit KdpA n=1 Tax=Nakamurella lactea TaxID=459515 RepID=UPI0003F93DB9|nr:potassium-transporting ATPase subunit KdpA [Nakamurella lactea]
MTGWLATGLEILTLVVLLGIVQRPLGDYIAVTLESKRHLRVERGLYRFLRIDSAADQKWSTYLISLLAFSLAGFGLLWLILSTQQWLPLSLGHGPMSADQGFNTAASFVANTNWQSYAGESTLGHTAQAAGLTVQNFVSAAVGIVVAVALIRGFVRNHTDRLGNFWVDLTRVVVRVLLPIAVVGATLLIVCGVIQNLASPTTITTLAGVGQTIPGGPVASQEVIKLLGTNGGGFFNANSAHPLENPNAASNFLQYFLILLIPVSLPRTIGRLLGNYRQGLAILGVMVALWAISLTVTMVSESAHPGSALQAAGGAMEGKETRFGVASSVLFATATTLTSTGAVDSMHSSYTGFGGGMLLLNMLIGEVAPGGVGSGIYGILILAVITVFVAGLMVGRTPTFLGKQIGTTQMKWAAGYLLVVPALVLVNTAIALLGGNQDTAANPDSPHGLTELLYASGSAANNNGSAFAGLSANTPFWNISLGVLMLLGRFVCIGMVLALAGSVARQGSRPDDAGTLPTHRPLFATMLFGMVILVSALTYLPALALGPIAEGLS